MADQQVPDHGTEALGVRSHVIRKRGGMTTQASATWAVKPPSRPTMPKIDAPAPWASSSARTMLTDTPRSGSPPPTENTSTPSAAPSLGAAQPFRERGVPTLVVGPGRELRDVVGRGVGLEAADLPEVVDGV